MKKVKKMADGGISGLGKMIGGEGGKAYPMPGGGGGNAMEGLGQVNQGASTIGNSLQSASSALSQAGSAIGGGGGGGAIAGGGDFDRMQSLMKTLGGGEPNAPMYKKGGKVSATRISTASRSKKSPNW